MDRVLRRPASAEGGQPDDGRRLPCDQPEEEMQGAGEVVVPLRLRLPDGAEATLLSTVATFGTPLDVTVAELVIESFFPADEETARLLSARLGPPNR